MIKLEREKRLNKMEKKVINKKEKDKQDEEG